MPRELPIRINSGTPITLEPSTQTVNVSTTKQEKFFWQNYDCEPHLPAALVNGEMRTDIFGIDTPIPGKKPDEPVPTSKAVFLATTGTFTYVIDTPEGVQGTIVVINQ